MPTPSSLQRPMLIGKIHRATVTAADLHYVGSVTVDADLLDAANLLPGQQVDVVDITNGARLTTYAIPGERGQGEVKINGAAAHHIRSGDVVIVIAYGMLSDADAHSYTPSVVLVDAANRVLEVGSEPGQVPDTGDALPFPVQSSGVPFEDARAGMSAGR
ncbi:aspartate 1-decarboxylase [Georgenia sp. SYP-B2076]|uniref:aspartate 1-decarboxylase n=1 Tax=Georgenia sp. SYP-B2076 TaxID=2495881 RepID=UPI000F8DFE7E|nr:aspartate 1-decarboxylase [Georgenia sp. SYP-B2076]